MRFELAGTISSSGPPGPGNPSNPPELTLIYTADDTLDAKSYADQGYTAYEVLCVGAAGGSGGGYYMPTAQDPTRTPGDFTVNGYKFFGGGAGGGGLHKIAGDLIALPDSVDIKVGAGGAAGTWQDDPDPVTTPYAAGVIAVTDSTDGVDGGYSSFNDPTCRASGGKGGKRVENIWRQGSATSPQSSTVYHNLCSLLNDGGDGGLGDSVVAGGGGVGGKQKQYDGSGTLTSDSVPSTSGDWDGTIGGGGGGGFGGGIDVNDSLTTPEQGIGIVVAGDGSAGAYGTTDTLYASTGAPARNDPGVNVYYTVGNQVAGAGGGAQTAAFTGISAEHGDGVQIPLTDPGQDGIVIVRLYSK